MHTHFLLRNWYLPLWKSHLPTVLNIGGVIILLVVPPPFLLEPVSSGLVVVWWRARGVDIITSSIHHSRIHVRIQSPHKSFQKACDNQWIHFSYRWYWAVRILCSILLSVLMYTIMTFWSCRKMKNKRNQCSHCVTTQHYSRLFWNVCPSCRVVSVFYLEYGTCAPLYSVLRFVGSSG